jgi:signal peptidase II
LKLSSNQRIGILAVLIFALDQLSKLLVLRYMGYSEEKVVIAGFFKLVHWGNTGAAWSMFRDNNEMLAIVALVALLVLFLVRHRFDIHVTLGWISMGLMFGGIAGNLLDRMLPSRRHVIDFLYFYVQRTAHGSPDGELGFPAFNVADSAICIGVVLLFILSFQKDHEAEPALAPSPQAGGPCAGRAPASSSPPEASPQ